MSIWVHARGDDAAPWMLRPSVHACVPDGVERSDYTLSHTTSGMPDGLLDGRPASLEGRRVRPLFRTGCSATRALVLVHGRTISARPGVGLPYADYSVMATLARRGIDTFAVDHLGYG